MEPWNLADLEPPTQRIPCGPCVAPCNFSLCTVLVSDAVRIGWKLNKLLGVQRLLASECGRRTKSGESANAKRISCRGRRGCCILFPMARTARGDLGHGTARETMSRMPVVQIRRRIRTPRGISTASSCCLQPLVLSAVRPSVYYRCLLVPHSVTQLLEQRWTCSSKHALTGCLLSLHLRMSLALGAASVKNTPPKLFVSSISYPCSAASEIFSMSLRQDYTTAPS